MRDGLWWNVDMTRRNLTSVFSVDSKTFSIFGNLFSWDFMPKERMCKSLCPKAAYLQSSLPPSILL